MMIVESLIKKSSRKNHVLAILGIACLALALPTPALVG